MPERVFSIYCLMPWRRPALPPPVLLDPATVRELARLLAERLDAVKRYGTGGCPTCHEAEAHAFLAQLRKLPRRE
jgi:hypothetical protein